MFERKKKVYKHIAMVSQTSRENFLTEINNKVVDYQENGLEVEMQYQIGNTLTALILAYEME